MLGLHVWDETGWGIGPQVLCDHCVFEVEHGLKFTPEEFEALEGTQPPTAHVFAWKLTNGGSTLPTRVELGNYLMTLETPLSRSVAPYTIYSRRDSYDRNEVTVQQGDAQIKAPVDVPDLEDDREGVLEDAEEGSLDPAEGVEATLDEPATPSLPTGETDDLPGSEASLVGFGRVTKRGVGNARIDLESASAAGVGMFAVRATHAGAGNFMVHGTAGGEVRQYLVNAIGQYSGTTLLDASGVSTLAIRADGNWTVDLIPIADLEELLLGELDPVYGGSGDQVLRYFGEACDAVVSYEVQVAKPVLGHKLPACVVSLHEGDPSVISVEAEGNWTIREGWIDVTGDLAPPAAAVPTPAPAAADPMERLAKLSQLRAAGLLSEEEFQAKRQAVVDQL